jgi:ABC-2 type transport system ATP-binding protein
MMKRMLLASQLCKALGGRRVLDALELGCASGEVAVVLGANGAGKSTLLRVLSGIVEPDRGSVRVLGNELTGGGVPARRALGYVPDGMETLPDLRVVEFLGLMRSLKQAREEVWGQPLAAWRERLGLDGVWSQRLGSLSFGQRKRVCLLAALLGDPWLLLLDEPSNGLDPGGVELVLALISERQARAETTLLGTNDEIFAARLAATRYRLEAGKLVRCSPLAAR